jgi:hypothetical protein
MELLLGAAIGVAASGLSALVGYWFKTSRDLSTAAARCYERLLKIRDDPATETEFDHLGVAGDLYVSSIGAVLLRRTRRNHWQIYEQLVPIIMRHDVSGLDRAIEALEAVTKGGSVSGRERPGRGRPGA